MKKETIKNIGFVLLAILLIVITAMSAMSFRELYGGQWTCIANNCTEWATGDDWITDNCRPEGEVGNQTLTCKLTIEDNEYTAPLSIINLSNVRSCRVNSCITEVYVRGKITN
jgi:hypothetical protein